MTAHDDQPRAGQLTSALYHAGSAPPRRLSTFHSLSPLRRWLLPCVVVEVVSAGTDFPATQFLCVSAAVLAGAVRTKVRTHLLVSLRPMQACLSSSASFSLDTSWV